MDMPTFEHPWPETEQELIARIRDHLWGRDDLLKDPDDLWPLDHELAGHCYVASEAFFHLTGGYDRWQVERTVVTVPEPGPTGGEVEYTHWYLRNRDSGEVADLTYDQFVTYTHGDVEIPYDEGTATGFMTDDPSKRAQRVIDAVDYEASEPEVAV